MHVTGSRAGAADVWDFYDVFSIEMLLFSLALFFSIIVMPHLFLLVKKCIYTLCYYVLEVYDFF